jgi:hypothetical protein
MNNILNIKLLDKHLLLPLILIILLFVIVAYMFEKNNCSHSGQDYLNGSSRFTLNENSNEQLSIHNSERRG